jgi:hypothetical protein
VRPTYPFERRDVSTLLRRPKREILPDALRRLKFQVITQENADGTVTTE